MGKKKHRGNREPGAIKTARKTEKNLEKKARREAAAAQRLFQSRGLSFAPETGSSEVPSPRSSATLVCHPEKDELLLFGGEFFDGRQTHTYNDMYSFNIKKLEWSRLELNPRPAARSSHQAVVVRQRGGEMWMFGGGSDENESSDQYHHYNDLWVYRFSTRCWEQIRDYIYYNDLHAFSLDNLYWTQLRPSGTVPSARSGFQMGVTCQGHVIVLGGYAKQHLSRDKHVGVIYTDMHRLAAEAKQSASTEELLSSSWCWSVIKQSGVVPSSRCGLTMTTLHGSSRALLFGGVYDQEGAEEMQATFYDDLFCLDMDKGRWRKLHVRAGRPEKSSRRRKRHVAPRSPDASISGSSSESDSDVKESKNRLGSVEQTASEVKKLRLVGAGSSTPMEANCPRSRAGIMETIDSGARAGRMATRSTPNMDTTSTPLVALCPTCRQSFCECLVEHKHVETADSKVRIFRKDQENLPSTSKLRTSGDSAFEIGQNSVRHATGGPVTKLRDVAMSTPSPSIDEKSSPAMDGATTVAPCARMNAMTAIKGHTLYLYGGLLENGDRRLTLGDLYSLDTRKLDKWTLLSDYDVTQQAWLDSDSDSGQDSEEDDSSDSASDSGDIT